MKRGLVATEVPETTRAACAARVQRLRARLREAGCDAALIYGDVSRSDDIYYLANLCLYWNEGVLVVPARGEVTFVNDPASTSTSTVSPSLTIALTPGSSTIGSAISNALR